MCVYYANCANLAFLRSALQKYKKLFTPRTYITANVANLSSIS